MQLETEFIRLPLRFDAERLANEVLAFDEASWKPHPQGYAGNSALSLISAFGDPTNDATAGRMLPTPFLARCPYLRQVLSTFGAPLGRTRLMRLDGNAEATAHADTNYYWAERMRLHVPIVTTPRVEFLCGDRRVNMAPGEAWIFDTWRIHNVLNPEPTRRIHLVSDTVGSEELSALVAGGAWPFAEPARPGQPERFVPFREDVDPPLTFEARNQPVVMTPWEQAAHRDRLLDELEARVHGDAARQDLHAFEAELARFTERWRSLWHARGEDPAAQARYRALLEETERRLARLAGRLRVSNGIDAVEIARHWLLRPALNPQLAESQEAAARGAAAQRGAAPTGTSEPAEPAAPPRTAAPGRHRLRADVPPRFDRPIFIVSPPRSGSTLLFETLAQAPDLWTIGSESHGVFERIPAFHPAQRGWTSNRLTAEDARPALVERLIDGFFLQLRDRSGARPVAGAEHLRLLEKTPKNALRVSFLAAAFPDARFVYLYRNPRETISSMLDAWRSGKFVTYPNLPEWPGQPWSLALVPGWRELGGRPPAEIAARQWRAVTDVLLDDLAALPVDRWCIANYGALVEHPQQEIARLCAFLDLGWDRELTAPLPPSRTTLSSPEKGKWRKNAAELEPVLGLVAATAERALDLFAQRPGHADLPAAEEAVAAALRTDATAATRIDALEAAPLLSSPPATEAIAEAAPSATAESPVPRQGQRAPLASVHTESLGELLRGLRSSIAITTYQSGRVVLVRARDGAVNTHFSSFASPMGLAVRPGGLALGTKHHIWQFLDVPGAAPAQPGPRPDACYLPRRGDVTGDIRVHELCYGRGGELWFVNTRFSCLCTLDATHSFVPRWRPPFITALAAEDRCHLNGLCMVDGAPRYATALGRTDTPQGWRDGKANGGVLLDVASGEAVATGLSMPHSPRLHGGKLWVLESGKGELNVVDPQTGQVEVIAQLPGFTRGLAFAGPFAFVGLSQVRESVFGGIPLARRIKDRACGLWVVDTRSGQTVAFLRFEDAVQEIFDVQLLAGVTFPHLSEGADGLLDSAFLVPAPAPEIDPVASPTGTRS